MKTLQCHSLRTVPERSDVFFCAHPQLHAHDHRVTKGVCKSCRLRTEPAPDRFRAFSLWRDSLYHRAEIQLVVARYRENLDWLERFRGIAAIVYDKGDPRAENRLPNVGREAHTYLHHIVTHYDHLAPVTVFLQGDPYAHIANLDEKIWGLPSNVGFQELSDYILVEDAAGLPVHPGLQLKKLYESLFAEPSPEFFVCHSAACFAVSRENVRQRPREFYEKAMKFVVEHPLGPWEIERLWQYVFRTRVATEGVVTAAGAEFFGELQRLLLSCREQDRYPVAVLDLGLHEEQRRWCLQQRGVALLPMPRIYEPVEQIRRRHWWQVWLKPFFIFHAPFDRVLWIDADCTVVGDLAAAFEIIGERPLLVRDATSAATENHPDLYRSLPLLPSVRTAGVNLNAGVVGLCKIRDRALLNTWAYGVAWAAMNPEKQALAAWADQGMLLWAAHRTGQTQSIREDLAWNHPGRTCSTLIASAVKNGHSIVDEIRARYPGASIVHWLGVHKLSAQLEGELEHLFVQGP